MPPICVKFLFNAALLLASAFPVCSEGINKTLAEKYRACLDEDKNQSSGPTKSYELCLNVPPNATVNHDVCGIVDDSKCITFLADIPNFQNCVGPENLQTLRESGEIFHGRYDYFCNDGSAILKNYALHDGVKCEQSKQDKIESCSTEAKITVAESPAQLETLSGFTYDKQYCRALELYHNCTIKALEDCHNAVVDYRKLINNLRWKASPCAGCHLVAAPLLMAASGLLMILLTNTLKF